MDMALDNRIKLQKQKMKEQRAKAKAKAKRVKMTAVKTVKTVKREDKTVKRDKMYRSENIRIQDKMDMDASSFIVAQTHAEVGAIHRSITEARLRMEMHGLEVPQDVIAMQHDLGALLLDWSVLLRRR